MANKRMFDKKVVGSDKFIDLPNSSKALYFMAGMEADDKGFFQPRKLQRMCGFSDDDYKILIAKGFFITFESGVMVVTDWNKNNWLDSRRVTETEYIDELNMLKLINQKYEIIQEVDSAKQMLSQYSIEENSIEYNKKEIYKERNFKKPTLEEIQEYIKEKNMNVNPETFYNYFTESNWKDSKGNKVKNWKQKLITWNSYNKKEIDTPNWFDKDLNKQETTIDDDIELDNLLKEMESE